MGIYIDENLTYLGVLRWIGIARGAKGAMAPLIF